MNPALMEARRLRDAALTEHNYYAALAEYARELWIEASAQVAIFEQDTSAIAGHASQPVAAPKLNATPKLRLIRRAQAVKPNYSAIAREIGVSAQSVIRVAKGQSTSARILAAIEEHIEKQSKHKRRAVAT